VIEIEIQFQVQVSFMSAIFCH